MTTTTDEPTLTGDELWALLTVTEYPRFFHRQQIPLYPHAMTEAALTSLLDTGRLRADDDGYLAETGSIDPGQTDRNRQALLDAQHRHHGLYGPHPAQRPTATPAQRALLRSLWDRWCEAIPARVWEMEPGLIQSLLGSCLLEAHPLIERHFRISAAGHLAAALRPPAPGGLARMCAQARHHLGRHWTAERHHRYSELCRPDPAPVVTWRRTITAITNTLAEQEQTPHTDHDRHAALRRQQDERYRSIPDEVNYWTGADTDDHTE